MPYKMQVKQPFQSKREIKKSEIHKHALASDPRAGVPGFQMMTWGNIKPQVCNLPLIEMCASNRLDRCPEHIP